MGQHLKKIEIVDFAGRNYAEYNLSMLALAWRFIIFQYVTLIMANLQSI